MGKFKETNLTIIILDIPFNFIQKQNLCYKWFPLNLTVRANLLYT